MHALINEIYKKCLHLIQVQILIATDAHIYSKVHGRKHLEALSKQHERDGGDVRAVNPEPLGRVVWLMSAGKAVISPLPKNTMVSATVGIDLVL